MSATKTRREDLFIAVPRELFYEDLSAHGFMVMVYLYEQVDYNTGIVRTDARKILDGMNASGLKKCGIRSVQIGLKEAVKAGLIKTFYKKGSVYEYPILIDGFRVRQGKLKGLILDAKSTSNPKTPIYRRSNPPETPFAPVSLDALKHSENDVTENETDISPSASLNALKNNLQRTTSAEPAHLQRTFSALGAGVIQESQESQSVNPFIKRLSDGFLKITGKVIGIKKTDYQAYADLEKEHGADMVYRSVVKEFASAGHNWNLVKNPSRLYLSDPSQYLTIARIRQQESEKVYETVATDWTDEFQPEEDTRTPEQIFADRISI